MKWLVIENNAVRGWHESGRATELPAADGTRSYVDATDNDLIAQWTALARQIASEGRSAAVEWDGQQLVAPADTRPRIEVTFDRAPEPDGSIELLADGTDSVTVTVKVLRPNDTVNPNVNGAQSLEVDYEGRERRFRLDFTAGIASRAVSVRNPGRYRIRSTDRYRVVNGPILLFATE